MVVVATSADTPPLAPAGDLAAGASYDAAAGVDVVHARFQLTVGAVVSHTAIRI